MVLDAVYTHVASSASRYSTVKLTTDSRTLKPASNVFFNRIYTLEDHCTGTAQPSRGGCSRRVHKIEYLGVNKLGDNCIQNFHFGWYIDRYTV